MSAPRPGAAERAVERVPSPNHDARREAGRVDMIVLHYTEMASAKAAVSWLCDPASRVSAHYLVAADGAIVAMVDEERRAWHAGVSAWDGSSDVNSRSIGIELDSPGHAPEAPAFPDAQIVALLDLLAGIRTRWPVPRRGVVAHSDVAPLRKKDPGEGFPWRRLARAGHALHVPPGRGRGAVATGALRGALAACGYGIPSAGGPDELLDATVTAFHRRHMPDRVGSSANADTLATAEALARAVAEDRRLHPAPYIPGCSPA